MLYRSMKEQILDDEFGIEDIEFESNYRDFEHNRMYPLSVRKGAPTSDVTTRDRMFELRTENHNLNQVHLSMCRKETPMSYASMEKEIIRFELLRFRLNPMSLPWYRKEPPMCAVLRMNGMNLEPHGTFKVDIPCPQKNRKEPPMIKLSQKHVDAICHCELFIDPIFAKIDSARLRKHLEDDLLSLAELKLYIYTVLAQGPKFPSMGDYDENVPGNPKSRV